MRLVTVISIVAAAAAIRGRAAAAPDAPTTAGPSKPAVQATLTYYGDLFEDTAGGVRPGVGYDGRLGLIVDADLGEALGWSGAALHASVHEIHGTQFSASHLGNLMTVSGIEARPSIRLFNLWVEQQIGEALSVRVGQFTAAQEFLVSPTANLFVNATFGWPALMSSDLPSGGPSYPEATPGVRVAFTPGRTLTFRAAVFDGDPAGPGPAGDPVQRDPYGLAFRVRDPPLVIAEGVLSRGGPAGGNPTQEGGASGAAGLAGSVRLGAWLHAGRFADQSRAAGGGPIVGDATPLQHRTDFGVYVVVDQTLWRSPAMGRTLAAFARLAGAPSDRNPIDLYADGGFSVAAPLASRPEDTFGVALALARASPRLSALGREVSALNGAGGRVGDFEMAAEITYQAKISSHWTLQPDLQIIIHPGARTNQGGSGAPPRDALVVGARAMARY